MEIVVKWAYDGVERCKMVRMCGHSDHFAPFHAIICPFYSNFHLIKILLLSDFHIYRRGTLPFGVRGFGSLSQGNMSVGKCS